MISWFENIRNKPSHVRQKIVFGIAFFVTVCIFFVWGISKFRILSHKVEEARSQKIEKPASPFAVFGKSIKNIFTDINIPKPAEEGIIVDAVEKKDIQSDDNTSDIFESEMQMYFGEDFESIYDVSKESSDISEDSMDFYGENQ